MTNPARSPEGRVRFENVQRAVRLSARLSTIGFDDLDGLRAAFSELIGKPVGDRFMVAQFYADIEGHPDQKSVRLALEELSFFSREVRILGVYPAHAYRRQA